jgi:hypothetical protein
MDTLRLSAIQTRDDLLLQISDNISEGRCLPNGPGIIPPLEEGLFFLSSKDFKAGSHGLPQEQFLNNMPLLRGQIGLRVKFFSVFSGYNHSENARKISRIVIWQAILMDRECEIQAKTSVLRVSLLK